MTEPTDDEIAFFARAEGIKVRTGAGAVKLVRAALAKWGNQAQAEEPVAWAATSEDGVVEALGMNQSRRFDTPLYLAPQPVAREPLTDEQITAAAKKLAECMDYPWEFMPEPGRKNMRKHAQDVIGAAYPLRGKQ